MGPSMYDVKMMEVKESFDGMNLFKVPSRGERKNLMILWRSCMEAGSGADVKFHKQSVIFPLPSLNLPFQSVACCCRVCAACLNENVTPPHL